MVIQVGHDADRIRARRRRQGAALRKLRKLHGITMAELAARIGVTEGAVSQWECGRITPRQQMQIEIAKALDVPHSSIFGLDQETAP